MANIPIRDIPGAVVASPDPSNLIPMDNGSIMQKTTIANAVNATLPLSSQAEAEAGVDNAKRMSSLRTKQAIDAQTPAIVNVAITALNLGTMSQEEASDYTPTSGLADVALSNDYDDLDNLPTLGTAAALDVGSTSGDVAAGDRGLPTGGTTAQALVKASNSNYDVEWVTSAAATAVSYAAQSLTVEQQAQARANIDAIGLSEVQSADSKATPVDADSVPLIDSAASNALKRLTWANLKAALGSAFLSLTGGTLTGFLTLHANPTTNLHAATKQYVDGILPATVSQSEAQAGTSTTQRMWTAQRVNQAITALAPESPVGLYTGTSLTNTNFPVGHHVLTVASSTSINANQSASIYVASVGAYQTSSTGGTILSGTWRSRGHVQGGNSSTLMQRTA